METPLAEPLQAIEQPAIETGADGGAIAEAPTGGGADAFVADGGDRTAMVSTAHVSMRLVFKPGEANVEEFAIKKSEIAIGRGTTCDIILADKKSSASIWSSRRSG